MIVAFFNASLALFEYALTNPPAPNLIPPKYLTIIHTKFVMLLFLNTLSAGKPAVPLGSPSSFAVPFSPVLPMM